MCVSYGNLALVPFGLNIISSFPAAYLQGFARFHFVDGNLQLCGMDIDLMVFEAADCLERRAVS